MLHKRFFVAQMLNSQCVLVKLMAVNTYLSAIGDREVAQELASRGKEHNQLGKEARQSANQAAYESCNVHVMNRFKVSWDTCEAELASLDLLIISRFSILCAS